jgi:two-component system, LuxR family, response regulator FixJ
MDRANASTVAIIDDDEDVRDVLGMLLETAGHSVQTYQSGIQFLADPGHAEVACLVIDQNMPKMTGLELLLEMERRGLSIPSLLITGSHDPRITEEADRLGAMIVMQKPVPTHELLQFVAFSAGSPSMSDDLGR